MKFVFCTQRYVPPLVGGVDVLTHRITSRLVELGHVIRIIAVDVSGNTASLVVDNDSIAGIPVTRVSYDPKRRSEISKAVLCDDEIGRFFYDFLAAERPDIFVLMNLYGIGASPIESARELGIPAIMILTDFTAMCRRATLVTWNGRECPTGESIKSCAACFVSHNPLGRFAVHFLNLIPERSLGTISERLNRPESRFFNPLGAYWRQVYVMRRRLDYLKAVFPYLSRVLVANQFAYDVSRQNGFSSEQLEVLTWPIDTKGPLASLARQASGQVRFLFIGRYHPIKGPHILIEAFGRLERRNDATLTLYGAPDAGHEDYLSGLKEAVAGRDGIELNGPLENNRLAEAFAKADYFVLPSAWHENNTLIVPDALLSQTPVISSRIRGVAHLVIDGENGVLFEMGNVQDLSAKMQMVIDEHPKIFRRLSRPWTNALSIENYSNRFVRISEEILEEYTLPSIPTTNPPVE